MQGILGGTFDPPHIAHLSMARAAHLQLGLEVVRLMPAADPWQKSDTAVTAVAHRWAMAVLLAAEDENVVADDTEIIRTGPSYTIETIEQLGERFVLVLGADAALGIPTWHRGLELVEMVDLAVAPRPGIAADDVERAVGTTVTWLDMDPTDLSSTHIRDLVAAEDEYGGLVAGSVHEYIETNKLYRPTRVSSSRSPGVR